MPKPWEKYQAAPTVSSSSARPWDKYKEAPVSKSSSLPVPEDISVDEGPRFLKARMVNPKTGKVESIQNVTDVEYNKKLRDGWQEVDQVPNPKFLGMRDKALAKGMASGATLGFSDEIVGGVKSLLNDKTYAENRDEYRAERDVEQRKYPASKVIGNLMGGAVPAIATGGIGALSQAPVITTATLGGMQGLGDSEADLTKGEGKEAMIDTAWGAISAATLAKIFQVAPKVGQVLKESAGKMMEKATGATGKFAKENFPKGTGRKMIDEGLGRFFDSPANIAERAQSRMGDAGKLIDDAVLEMDKSGQVITKDAILKKIKEKMSGMEFNSAQAPVMRQLESYMDDVQNATPNVSRIPNRSAGPPPSSDGFTPSLAENVKRDYANLTNFVDPEKDLAKKAMGGAYREAVEDAAMSTSPEIAEKFAKGKSDWGFLAPIEQAASNRAAQLKQSPVGGFLDTTTAAASAAVRGSGPMAVADAVARRMIAPRLASSTAIAADKAGDVLSTEIPGFAKNMMSRSTQIIQKNNKDRNQSINIQAMGKFAPHLEQAKQRGPEALAATDYILGMSNPEYRELKNNSKMEEQENGY